jgi:hypothetical protein
MNTNDDAPFTTPADLICPITSELFYDPCINAAGMVYERYAIEKAMQLSLARDGLMKDPLTNQVLPNSNLMQVHMVRGRAIEYRERTVKACVDKLAGSSNSSPIVDLARYLVRASELILPPSVTSDPSLSSSATPQALAYAPGINVVTASAILATSTSGPSTSYTAGRIVEIYAEGLLHEGIVDAAAGLYLRLLLQLGDGDRELQTRALRSCLDCWSASSDDPLHRLACYIESYPASDKNEVGPLQVIDLIEDGALALSLTERLLTRIMSSPLPDELKEVARQSRTAVALVQKASKLRHEMAMGVSGREDRSKGGASANGSSVSKSQTRGGMAQRHQGRSKVGSFDEDSGEKKRGPGASMRGFVRGVKGIARGLIKWRVRWASGVFAALSFIPRPRVEGADPALLVIKGIQAVAFVLAVASSDKRS